jgi:hypothetical protein
MASDALSGLMAGQEEVSTGFAGFSGNIFRPRQAAAIVVGPRGSKK